HAQSPPDRPPFCNRNAPRQIRAPLNADAGAESAPQPVPPTDPADTCCGTAETLAAHPWYAAGRDRRSARSARCTCPVETGLGWRVGATDRVQEIFDTQNALRDSCARGITRRQS